MSWPFAAQSTAPPAAGQARTEAPDHDLNGYLTDGVELYRSLGAIRLGPSQIIGLENCRSLDVVLMALEELRGRGLRPVTPAA